MAVPDDPEAARDQWEEALTSRGWERYRPRPGEELFLLARDGLRVFRVSG